MAKESLRLSKRSFLKLTVKKSPDGKRFIKSEELSTAFSQTEAYSQLFMELATDADAAAKFVNGIIPVATTPVNTGFRLHINKKVGRD